MNMGEIAWANFFFTPVWIYFIWGQDGEGGINVEKWQTQFLNTCKCFLSFK